MESGLSVGNAGMEISMLVMEEKEQEATETAERIGRLEFEVRRSAGSPDFQQRYADRADALAAWLLAQWRLEHQDWQNN